jgi:hypothetical protein
MRKGIIINRDLTQNTLKIIEKLKNRNEEVKSIKF